MEPVPASSSSSATAYSRGLLRAAAARFRGDAGTAAMARSAVGVFAVNVAGTALNVALQVWLARLLGVAEFGIYAYVLAWSNVLLVAGVMGQDNAAMRFLPAYRGTGELGRFWGFLRFTRGRIWLLSLAVSLLLAGGTWVLRERLGAHKALAFWVGSVLLLMNVQIAFNGALLQALKRVVQSKSLQFVVRLVTVFSLLAALHFLLGRRIDAVAAMIVNGASALFVLGGLRWLIKRELPPRAAPECDRTLRAEWSSVSRSLFAISGCQLMLSQVDVLLVGVFLGTTQVGLYAAANRIATIVTFGISSVNTVLAPTIAELFARKQRRELQATVVLASRIVMAYTLPMVAFLLIAGRWVLSWFGPQFVPAYPVLAVLVGGLVFPALSGSVGFLMTMTGHQREALAVIVGSALLTVGLNLALIPLMGPIGAAVGSTTATAARSLALGVLVRRRLGLHPTAFGL